MPQTSRTVSSGDEKSYYLNILYSKGHYNRYIKKYTIYKILKFYLKQLMNKTNKNEMICYRSYKVQAKPSYNIGKTHIFRFLIILDDSFIYYFRVFSHTATSDRKVWTVLG